MNNRKELEKTDEKLLKAIKRLVEMSKTRKLSLPKGDTPPKKKSRAGQNETGKDEEEEEGEDEQQILDMDAEDAGIA